MTAHAPVTFVSPGANAWSPVTVVVVCRCGLQRLVPVVHHNEVHPLDRFTAALRAAHTAGRWPVDVAEEVAA